MERRIDTRRPTGRQVGCQGPAGSTPSRLRDISQTGCRLEVGSTGLAVGFAVAIELVDHICVHGIVRWVEGEQAGIEFTIRLHETMVETLVAGADNVSFVASRKALHLHDKFGRALPRLGGRRPGRFVPAISRG